jgi:hypothetical protein
MAVFIVVTQRGLVEKFTDHSEEHTASIFAMMMEAIITSEPLVNFYQITLHSIPEGSHLPGAFFR